MKNSSFNVNINLTWSKIMALLVLGTGSAATYILKDVSVFITTIGAVTAILGIRQVVNGVIKNKIDGQG